MEIKDFTMTPFYTNCYVVSDGGEAIVMDPGEASEALLEYLKPFKVLMIINTHAHCDHCGGNEWLKDKTGAPLLLHEADLPLLQTVRQQGMMFGVDFPTSPMPDRFLQEGEVLTVGAVSFTVRLVPGHAPGHVALVGPGMVFSGDVLFSGSIGRTDLPGGDSKQLMTSIKTELMTLPDETVVYSGHGPITTIGVERISNPFLVTL